MGFFSRKVIWGTLYVVGMFFVLLFWLATRTERMEAISDAPPRGVNLHDLRGRREGFQCTDMYIVIVMVARLLSTPGK